MTDDNAAREQDPECTVGGSPHERLMILNAEMPSRRSSRKRHVVILDESLPVPLNRRAWLEALSLVEAGYEVTVISPMGGVGMALKHETLDGVRIIRYPQRAATGLAGYLVEYVPSMLFTTAWLLWLRSHRRIDALQGCNPPDLFWVLGLAGRLFGASYVYDQQDANPELSTAKWGGRRVGRLLRWFTEKLERASYDTADLVLVPNDSYAGIARERGNVEERRLAVVRNAPPVGHFHTLAEGHSPQGDSPFRFGYLGVMGSQDGVEVLVEAAAILRQVRPGLQFVVDLVGDGEARPRLERLAAELGVADRLIFHGYRQADYFVPLLATSHVCICPDPPTRFNNVSTMTKVVEYLAMGRPVLLFDLHETRSVAGAAGLMVDEPNPAGLGRAMARIAEERPLLDRLTVAAGNRLDELSYSWESSSLQLVSAYSRLFEDDEDLPA
jgi:glycosyltransferase involved in cell wall biosynthesis